MRLSRFGLAILLCWCLPLQANTPLNIFSAGGYTRILQQHAEQHFVMVFWSVDCPSCLSELAMLGKFKQRYPQFNLILISTDTIDAEDEIQSSLEKYGLNNESNWVFASDRAQRLRYEIDKSWFGEVPRSYLFDNQHQRHTITGELNWNQLEDWIESVKN